MNIEDVIAIFSPAEGFAAERLEICANCTDYKPAAKRCGVCNCILPLKVKAPHQRCPINKWEPINE